MHNATPGAPKIGFLHTKIATMIIYSKNKYTSLRQSNKLYYGRLRDDKVTLVLTAAARSQHKKSNSLSASLNASISEKNI